MNGRQGRDPNAALDALLWRATATAAAERGDAAAWWDPRFLDWLARERRARDTVAADTARGAGIGVAAALQARIAAERARVRCIDAPPVVRPAAHVAPVSDLLAGEAAAAAGCAPWLDLAVAAGAGRELWDEACECWVELPEEPPRGALVALTVSGASMEPLMHSGDVVLVKRGGDLRRDSVIVARRPEHGYVVKRVGRIGADSVELLSLNRAFAPITIGRREELVLGTVVLRWCDHHRGSGRRSARD